MDDDTRADANARLERIAGQVAGIAPIMSSDV
jgi:DNA-binding FrmR family transcriptional regulator